MQKRYYINPHSGKVMKKCGLKSDHYGEYRGEALIEDIKKIWSCPDIQGVPR